MNKGTRNVWVVLAATAVVFTGCAMHNDVIILDKRMQVLKQQVSKQETELQTLHTRMSQNENNQGQSSEKLRGSQADLRTMVNELRGEIQSLRGTLEEDQYRVRQQVVSQSEREARREKLQKTIQIALDRVVRLEQYLGLEPSEKLVTKPAPGADSDTKKPPPAQDPEALYLLAKQQFDKGEYENARETFQSFLKKYPKSKDADNAQFWLGEVYYREKWYEKAILEYQKVIEGYPKGNKVRSALLKQGFAFRNLGDKDNARLILKELARKYPKSNEAKIAKDKLSTF